VRSLLLIAVLLSLTACGKKGALYYPDMLVPDATTVTSVSQIGSSVKLQFVLPHNDRMGHKLADLAGVKINKRQSDSIDESSCSSCTTDYHLFRTLYLDLLPEGALRYGNRMLVLDGDVSVGKTYSYRVVPFTKGGLDGLASPQVSVRLVQPTLPPIVHAESFPTEIRISCVTSPPVAGSFIGFNIYRSRQEDAVSYVPINREPLVEKDYTDSGIDRNVKYRYMARTLIKLESGDVVESPLSNVVDGMLKNDE